jgi:hypothetical protein
MSPLAAPPIQSRGLWQCAWCRRLMDRTGGYGRPVRYLLLHANYGICPPCAARFRAEIDAYRAETTAA